MDLADMKKILAPIDFSECSWTALEAAASLAKKLGATVDVLHVWQPPPYVPLDAAFAMVGAGPPQTLAAIAEKQANDEMMKFVEQLEQRGFKATHKLFETGNPATRISEIAKEGNYDLVVIGTHGRSGLKRLLMGSVAERVVRLCERPVLSVRGPE